MLKNIAILPGDGIGPEVMKEGVKVLKAVEVKYDHKFILKECLVGGIAYDQTGHPLPEETINTCNESDAILLAAVGGKKWENLPDELTPEKGALLPLRKRYTYDQLRPAVTFKPLLGKGQTSLDLLIVREGVGGIYFNEHFLDMEEGVAWDQMKYTRPEIERVTRVACEAAMKRKRKLTNVDKANVLSASKLWRKVVVDLVTKNYPEIELNHEYIDIACGKVATNPGLFDVMLASNLFGDILSDTAMAITGSMGMLPGACLGPKGIYEPVHGSAPDIAGKGIANPIAMILAVSMMLKYSFGMIKESEAIEKAVEIVLEKGYRTFDIATKETTKEKVLSTSEMGNVIGEEIIK